MTTSIRLPHACSAVRMAFACTLPSVVLAIDVASATSCPNPPLTAGTETCQVTAGDASLLLRGAVLVPGDVLDNGQLLIDATGTIVCAACDCSAAPGFASATRVDCADGVIAPGLINGNDLLNFTHDDPGIWGDERFEHRHDWRLGQNGHTDIPAPGGASAAQVRWGELRQLFAGATSMRGNTSQAGLVRNLDTASTEGLTSASWVDDNFPLGDTGGARLDGSCAYPSLPTAPIGAPYWIDVAEGIDATAHNEFVCLSDGGGTHGGVDVIAGAMLADAIAITPADVAEIAAAGASVVWSPRSNLALYGRTAPITELHRRGVPLVLGTDWIVTGSMSMSRELACADAYNRHFLAGRLSDEELVNAAARNAAIASAMDDEIGVLATGRKADIAVFARAGRDHLRAVIESSPARIALVLRAGKPLLGENDALASWPGGICSDAAIDVCGHELRPCLSGELGITYPQLAIANAASYPAFFCDVPTDEPTCLPSRPLESGGFPIHGGIPTASDFDGDGVPNEQDDCPVIFDAATIDPASQGDADSDGVGDACDFCPTSPSATGCGESVSGDLIAALEMPATIVAGRPFHATLLVTNAGAAVVTARATLPTLRDLASVSFTCSGANGATCPASGVRGLDAPVSVPPGAHVTFAVTATHAGPATLPDAPLIAVASAVPDATFGESAPLDNYDAAATAILDSLIFDDDFEDGNTNHWSSTVP